MKYGFWSRLFWGVLHSNMPFEGFRTTFLTWLRPCSGTAALSAGRGQATGAVGLAALDPDCPLLVLAQLSDSYTYSRVIAKVQVLNPCQVSPARVVDALLCGLIVNVIRESTIAHGTARAHYIKH